MEPDVVIVELHLILMCELRCPPVGVDYSWVFSSAFKLNVVFSLIFNSLLAADSLLVSYSAKVPGKERVLEQTYGRSGDEVLRRMNILSLVVHGQKEAPDLGALTRKVETPHGDYQTAILGGCFKISFYTCPFKIVINIHVFKNCFLFLRHGMILGC